jgi:hypothetical protein
MVIISLAEGSKFQNSAELKDLCKSGCKQLFLNWSCWQGSVLIQPHLDFKEKVCWRSVQAAELLSPKHKTLSSNHSTALKKKKSHHKHK